jgi:ribose transport system ATP-binding protein
VTAPAGEQRTSGTRAVPHRGLVVSELSKHYGGPAAALDRVGFAAEAGAVQGLVGGNGSGKSTLIKILAGVVQAGHGGTVTVDGRTVDATAMTPPRARAAGLRFVHQDLGLCGALSVAENIFLGDRPPTTARALRWDKMRQQAREVVAQLGVELDVDAPVAAIGPAGRALVAVARAVRDPDACRVLVLDEPTTSLPAREAESLLASVSRLADAGRTVLFVGHRLDEVLSVATTVHVLRDGRFAGSHATEGLDESRLAALIVGRQVAAAAHRAAPRPGAHPVLRVRGLGAGPLHDVTVDVHAGEIVGLAGLAGSGRTRLLRAVAGAARPDAGSMSLDGQPYAPRNLREGLRAGIAYLPEDRLADAAFPDLSVARNLAAGDPASFGSRAVVSRRAENEEAARAVDAFSIRTPTAAAPLGTLSGGNQQKVVLARCLRRGRRLLLLDEPTQGVDVAARADIHARIRAAVGNGSAAVVVSSDFDELARLCDRVVVLAGGTVAAASPSPVDAHWIGERSLDAKGPVR